MYTNGFPSPGIYSNVNSLPHVNYSYPYATFPNRPSPPGNLLMYPYAAFPPPIVAERQNSSPAFQPVIPFQDMNNYITSSPPAVQSDAEYLDQMIENTEKIINDYNKEISTREDYLKQLKQQRASIIT